MSLCPKIPAHITAYMEVDLAAIAHNYRSIQKKLSPGTQCGAVIKAYAYGVGLTRVAQTLHHTGCRDFFVANFKEGERVREILPDDAHIYVLNGILPGTEEEFDIHRLTPCLISMAQVERWNNYGLHHGKKMPAILHMDTGLSREGLTPQEYIKFSQSPFQQEGLDIRYLMSHLSSAADRNTSKNHEQMRIFKDLHQYMPHLKVTFANSCGSEISPEFHGDLVRPGLALYGYARPAVQGIENAKPAVQVYGRVLLTRWINQGDSVSYFSTFTASHPTRLATIGLGYADGLMRSASNQGILKIQGYEAPIRGRIAMDYVIVDVTHIPEDYVYEGAWFSLFETGDDLINFATTAGTTPYEILTRFGKRYHRVYKEDVPFAQDSTDVS
jgi:alanine racemase